MTIECVLDTDVIIDVQREYSAALDWIARVNPATIGIPVYVALELIQDARNMAEASACALLVGMYTMVVPDESTQRWAVGRFPELHLAHGTGLVDILVAATAISFDVPLYTFNVRHYRHVPGLRIVQPYAR